MDKIAMARNIRQDIFDGRFGCAKVPCLRHPMFASLDCSNCPFSFCAHEHSAAFDNIKNYMPMFLGEG